MHRTLVLNANYEFLTVLDRWIDGLSLVLSERADALAHYPQVVHSAYRSFQLPAVVVLRQLVKTTRRRAIFDIPTRTNVFARDGFTCQYCGVRVSLRTGTRDHVMPRSRGGRDVLGNVVTACAPCNLKKDNRTPAEAGMALAQAPRPLSDEDKLATILRTVRSSERQAWLGCLRRHGITLWTAKSAA